MMRSATVLLLAASLAAADPAGPATAPATLSLADAVRVSAAVAGVRLADLSQAAADQGVRVERGGLLPQASVIGTVSRATSPSYADGYDRQPGEAGPYTSLDGRIRIGQALLDLSWWYRTDAAKADARSATAAKRTALESAAAAAAAQYAALAQAQAQVAARRGDLRLAEELAVLAEAQVAAGVAEPINATRARTQVSVARGALLVAENRESQAHVALARALDLDQALRFALASPFDDRLCATSAPLAADAAVSLALAQRPELSAATAAIDAERQRADAIRGERLGSLQAYGEGARTGPAVDSTAQNWTIGLQYTVPVFDGLRREGRIEVQEIAARRARLTRDDLRLQISAEARSAVIDLDSGERYRVVAKERVALAEQELSQSRDRFRVGVASNLDVIAAQQTLSTAQDADIEARATLATARARLARAVGLATALQ